jgi:hypothetical protein
MAVCIIKNTAGFKMVEEWISLYSSAKSSSFITMQVLEPLVVFNDIQNSL